MFVPATLLATPFATISEMFSFVGLDPLLIWIVAAFFVLAFIAWLSVRFVPNDYVAIVDEPSALVRQ